VPLPKRKLSKARGRRRRAANRYQGLQLSTCPECGKATRPHRVCPGCGTYRGRSMVTIEAEE